MTYDEFLSTIESYTIRSINDMPFDGFVRRAESYLRTVTKHYLAETTVVLPIVAGAIDLPADFIEIRSITGAKRYKPVAVQAAVLCENEVGYYRSGNRLVFVGEPDETIELLYWAAFADLTEDQSNWLFDRFPNVYISAVLKEFHRWQTDPEGVQIESAALQEALSIVAEDDRRGRQTGPIIMGGNSWR
ncbi:hypothetical protein [Neorhizobium sp. NCHU2750]|uniref:phage adaptor protein n=1 Tax=Neorhizobium sp. NCHU2750 TaxID=1825976 RepID=UPI000E707114|nr:hypothetical protein NCHU2750_15280 [Neorhizobium sp. NCHU2750]